MPPNLDSPYQPDNRPKVGIWGALHRGEPMRQSTQAHRIGPHETSRSRGINSQAGSEASNRNNLGGPNLPQTDAKGVIGALSEETTCSTCSNPSAIDQLPPL